MSAETIWLIGLMITHVCAYIIGKADRSEKPLDDEARLELEKYQIDRFYEHERWREERGIDDGTGA